MARAAPWGLGRRRRGDGARHAPPPPSAGAAGRAQLTPPRRPPPRSAVYGGHTHRRRARSRCASAPTAHRRAACSSTSTSSATTAASRRWSRRGLVRDRVAGRLAGGRTALLARARVASDGALQRHRRGRGPLGDGAAPRSPSASAAPSAAAWRAARCSATLVPAEPRPAPSTPAAAAPLRWEARSAPGRRLRRADRSDGRPVVLAALARRPQGRRVLGVVVNAPCPERAAGSRSARSS